MIWVLDSNFVIFWTWLRSWFFKNLFCGKKKALGQRKTFTLDDFGFGYQAYLHFIFTV